MRVEYYQGVYEVDASQDRFLGANLMPHTQGTVMRGPSLWFRNMGWAVL